MTNPKLKLTYFDMKGHAEAIRLSLVLGSIEFEDDRIAMKDWPVVKKTSPFGQLPYLTVDGVQVAQTGAILRYCGLISGHYPTDIYKACLVDQIGLTVDDIINSLQYTWLEKDLTKQKSMVEHIYQDIWPPLFKGLEQAIKQHGIEWTV